MRAQVAWPVELFGVFPQVEMVLKVCIEISNIPGIFIVEERGDLLKIFRKA